VRGFIAIAAASMVSCTLFFDVSDLATRKDGGAMDGSADSAMSDGPITGFCRSASGYAFCDDFDEDGGAVWDGVFLDPKTDASITIDPGESRSAPSSLLSIVPPTTTSVRNYWAKHFGPFSSIHVEADILLEASDPVVASIIQVWFSTPRQYSVELNLQGQPVLDTFAFTDGGSYWKTSTPISIGLSTWQHLVLDIDGTNALVSLHVNDEGSPRMTLPLSSPVPQSGADLQIGISYVDSNKIPWRMRTDNVLVRTVPP
jgi:hypothetical protein